MRRRTFMAGLAGAAVSPLAAGAQPTPLPVIGFLNSASPDLWAPYVAAYRAGLKQSGYDDGRNVAIEYRWAESRYERLPALAADLVAKRVAVIAATGGVAAIRAAMTASQTIPVVFTSGGDPVALGLVASLGRPGGNVTGISIIARDLMPKRLELLSELVPTAMTIAVLMNPTNPDSAELSAIEAAMRVSGKQLQIVAASTEDELDHGFASFTVRRPDALLVAADPFFDGRRAQLAALAVRYAIPAMYAWREYVDAGGLISYGPSLTDAYRQAGGYTGKVLSGTKPADLPVQEPTRFELLVNFKIAKALGLTIPPSILARADEVIE
jgi:putative tryptophan/tyrosine transport system substrate-binding protein